MKKVDIHKLGMDLLEKAFADGHGMGLPECEICSERGKCKPIKLSGKEAEI